MVEAVREPYDGMKVFSVTKARDRNELGDTITTWIRDHKEYVITETCVLQSSDAEFHCLSVLVFYKTHP